MLSVKGMYENGQVKLKERVAIVKDTPVIITFLEELDEKENQLSLEEFSFHKSRELLKDYSGSLSEAVIEERRSFL